MQEALSQIVATLVALVAAHPMETVALLTAVASYFYEHLPAPVRDFLAGIGIDTPRAVNGLVEILRYVGRAIAHRAAAIFALFGIFAATGCGGVLYSAAQLANGAAEVQDRLAPVLADVCVEPMQAAAEARDRAAAALISERCDRPVAAYSSLRAAHVALLAAIEIVRSGGDPQVVVEATAGVLAELEKVRAAFGGVQ